MILETRTHLINRQGERCAILIRLNCAFLFSVRDHSAQFPTDSSRRLPEAGKARLFPFENGNLFRLSDLSEKVFGELPESPGDRQKFFSTSRKVRQLAKDFFRTF